MTRLFFGGVSRQILKTCLQVAHRKEHFRVFWAIFWLLDSLQKRCLSTQEFTRFLSTVLSQRRATRSDVSFQTKQSECLVTLFLINCFGIEMVLCDLYLKRFDLTKGLLFDTFVLLFGTNCVVTIIQYWSSNHFHH